jgi:hypothetical protein
MMNPLHFNKTSRMYPIKVEYVFETYDPNDPVLRKLIEYCLRMNIKLIIRAFNPQFLEEDRDCITKLPALQIYENDYHEHTHYLDENIIKIIQTIYEKFELMHFEQLAKKQIWDEKVIYLKRLFRRSLLKTDSKEPKDKI